MNFTRKELESLGLKDNHLVGYFYLYIKEKLYISVNESEDVVFLNIIDEEGDDWKCLDLEIEDVEDLSFVINMLNA